MLSRSSTLWLALGLALLAASGSVAQEEGPEVKDSEEPQEAPAPAPAKQLSPSPGPKTYYDGRNFLLMVDPGFVLQVFKPNGTGSAYMGKS